MKLSDEFVIGFGVWFLDFGFWFMDFIFLVSGSWSPADVMKQTFDTERHGLQIWWFFNNLTVPGTTGGAADVH